METVQVAIWHAALSIIMARDRGEFMPKRQILIYPAVNNDYSEKSLFSSVRENGQDYLLTAGKLKDYINLYAGSEEDKLNPYFAPILEKDLSGQPDTLILTSEFDPLRDEGEAYGRRLAEAGNRVEVHRIKDALHGYFALGIRSLHVQESFEYINHFLEGGIENAADKCKALEKAGQCGEAFSGMSSKRDTRVFRFYCELKEDIQQEILQKAVDRTLEKYPIFLSVLCERDCSGIIWNRVIKDRL